MATTTMVGNCTAHSRRALDILQSTLLIAQGTGVGKWLARALDEAEDVPRQPRIKRVRFGENHALLATVTHPAAPTKENWGANAEQPYLRDVVTKTVAALHRLAGISAC